MTGAKIRVFVSWTIRAELSGVTSHWGLITHNSRAVGNLPIVETVRGLVSAALAMYVSNELRILR